MAELGLGGRTGSVVFARRGTRARLGFLAKSHRWRSPWVCHARTRRSWRSSAPTRPPSSRSSARSSTGPMSSWARPRTRRASSRPACRPRRQARRRRPHPSRLRRRCRARAHRGRLRLQGLHAHGPPGRRRCRRIRGRRDRGHPHQQAGEGRRQEGEQGVARRRSSASTTSTTAAPTSAGTCRRWRPRRRASASAESPSSRSASSWSAASGTRCTRRSARTTTCGSPTTSPRPSTGPRRTSPRAAHRTAHDEAPDTSRCPGLRRIPDGAVRASRRWRAPGGREAARAEDGEHVRTRRRARCGGTGNRTPDLLLAKQALYQLSYDPDRRASDRDAIGRLDARHAPGSARSGGVGGDTRI